MQTAREKIGIIMEAKGHTQMSFAKALNIAQTTVGQWQRGVCSPTPRMLQKISLYFGIPIEALTDNTQTLTIDDIEKNAKNVNKTFIQLDEALKKITSLRDELNETIQEIENLITTQITNIKKF